MNLSVCSVIFFAVIFSRNIIIESALSCYQCSEPRGRACELNVRSVLTENCTTGMVCAKFIERDNSTNITTLTRRCSESNICELERARESGNRNLSLTFCGTCNSTLCNSGPTNFYSPLAVFVSSAAIFATVFKLL